MIAASALADVKGEVESLGFSKSYRADAWTPIIVRLSPEAAQTDFYQLQVRQKDLDGDHVLFSRMISITGAEGAGATQRFLTTFLPQPSGLPDVTQGATRAELNAELKVVLLSKNGKELAQLPLRDAITNVDPPPSPFSQRRGVKLILAVSDGRSDISWSEFQDPGPLLGVVEDVLIVPIAPRDLPPAIVPSVEQRELKTQHRRLQFIEPAVPPARAEHPIFPFPAVLTKLRDTPGDIGTRRRDGAAVADGAQVLRRVETERGGVAE